MNEIQDIDNNESSDIIDIFTTFEDSEDGRKTYLYRKKENSKAYAWVNTYYDIFPSFEQIAKKFGAGNYKLIISSSNLENGIKKTNKICRSFIIDDFYQKEEFSKNDNTEILKILMPFLKPERQLRNPILDNAKLIDQVFQGQIKNYSNMLKEVRDINQNQNQNQYDDDDEDEIEENQMERIQNLLESYIPYVIGKTPAQVKNMLSNPLIAGLIKGIFKEIINDQSIFAEIKTWLVSKVGSEVTNAIIQAIN